MVPSSLIISQIAEAALDLLNGLGRTLLPYDLRGAIHRLVEPSMEKYDQVERYRLV